MNESDISPFDLERMFIGNADVLVLLEIAVRTSIIYVFALVLVRFLGKRGQAQLSPFEFVIIIALGSAVGDPMLYAEVPLAYSMVVITLVVIFNRGLEVIISKNDIAEGFVESRPSCLVVDGRLNLEALGRENLARDELFMSLRQGGIQQLGQVKRAYLEPSGQISSFTFTAAQVRPGLPLYPACDPEYRIDLSEGVAVPEAGLWACRNCGEAFRVGLGQEFPRCPTCQHGRWVLSSSAGQSDVDEG